MKNDTYVIILIFLYNYFFNDKMNFEILYIFLRNYQTH